MTRRVDLATLCGAGWALVALHDLRRRLRSGGFAGAAVIAPPRLPAHAVRGVEALLRRRDATCLERSLVLQKWFYSRGVARDVIVGVTSPQSGFAAHAWLDGETAESGSFHELRRLAPH
ncbi:MAG TPA: lasso peptide biosynthesis B2 protein [Gaiellaceae bacterium]|nr:lasso peptide biosynthesis B2 protein [Gaiellaceae bacterium]